MMFVLIPAASDDACHAPSDVGILLNHGEREFMTPPLTSFIVDHVDKTDRMQYVFVRCSYSHYMLSELTQPHEAVWAAVQHGDTETLSQWLRTYPAMNLEFVHEDFNCALLYSACRFGNLGCARELVRACAHINSQVSKRGSTPLHAAAYFGHSGVVSYLLDNLADPGIRNLEYKLTPLQEAASSTRPLLLRMAAPAGPVQNQLKAVADARELRYGSRASFVSGMKALVGPKVQSLVDEWEGRPDFEWTNHFGTFKAGDVWDQALRHVQDNSLMSKSEYVRSQLTPDELLACVLYTTNGYTVLNEWLRKLGKAREEKDDAEVRYLQGASRSWATTCYTITWALEKLGKLNVSCPPLYRGVKGALPTDFFVPDERGMVSITEFGFMSTTRDPEKAASFQHGAVSVLMTLTTKKEDAFGFHNGIDLEWLTFYPGEFESLFPPLTLFDVRRRSREGLDVTLGISPTFLFDA